MGFAFSDSVRFRAITAITAITPFGFLGWDSGDLPGALRDLRGCIPTESVFISARLWLLCFLPFRFRAITAITAITAISLRVWPIANLLLFVTSQ